MITEKKAKEEAGIIALCTDSTYGFLFNFVPSDFHVEIARRAKEGVGPRDISMVIMQFMAGQSPTMSSNGNT